MFYENKRHTIRLQKHDYSNPNYYFLTIGSYKHSCIFGEIKNGKFFVNEIGKIVENIWFSLPQHHNVILNTFQIMPNHIHFIINIVGAQRAAPLLNSKQFNIKTGSLSCVIRSFKSECSKQIHQSKLYLEEFIFQRNYYEHIIRNQNDLIKHQYYILNNPKNWSLDKEHPKNLKTKKINPKL